MTDYYTNRKKARQDIETYMSNGFTNTEIEFLILKEYGFSERFVKKTMDLIERYKKITQEVLQNGGGNNKTNNEQLPSSGEESKE